MTATELADPGAPIAERLAGKRIAITGTTGFLGTALVERLIRCVPDCSLVLLIRPGRRGVDQRLQREILRNDAFDRLREEHGAEGFAAMAAERILPIAADIGLHLARHGIRTDAQEVNATGGIGHALVGWAKDEHVDLIVMGAYGHSRFREAILGGATRNLLEMAEVPVLMAH